LQFLSYNAHAPYPHKVFECGDVVLPNESMPNRAEQRLKLAAAISDYKVGYEDIQAVAYGFLRGMGLREWEVRPLGHPSFIRGRAASILIRGEEAAILGELRPDVLLKFGITSPVAAFEADLAMVSKAAGVRRIGI